MFFHACLLLVFNHFKARQVTCSKQLNLFNHIPRVVPTFDTIAYDTYFLQQSELRLISKPSNYSSHTVEHQSDKYQYIKIKP